MTIFDGSALNFERHVRRIKYKKWVAESESTESIPIIRRKLKELKEKTPCVDCGRNFPSPAMDFDHRPGVEKLFSPGDRVLNQFTYEQILQEITKCDLVCACCHRMRTYRRKHGQS